MMITYSNESEAIETVYTYEEWLKEYKHRKAKQRSRQKMEHLHYMKQRILGAITVAIGIVIPLLLDGDATFSLVVLPLGIILLMTKEKVITF